MKLSTILLILLFSIVAVGLLDSPNVAAYAVAVQ